MFRKLSALWILCFLILTACAPTEQPDASGTQPATSQPQAQPLVVSDDTGKAIELEEIPQRIISLSPSITEILFAIGAGDQLVGREDFSLYPPEALDVPSVGSLWGDLPTETILALEPDLILVAEIISAEQVQMLEELGLTVYWQSNPNDFYDLYQKLIDIAVLTGHTAEAEALVADLKGRVAAVLDTVAAADKLPSVFYEMDGTDPANPWTAGGGTFIDTIITQAGGFNIAADMEPYPQISAETLISRNPEVILLADALYGVTPQSVGERPGWDVIQAVADNAIYGIDPNMMSVPGPRLVDALEEVARLLHPELFE